MLGSADAVRAVVNCLQQYPVAQLVVDPVMVATSGDRLLAAEAEAAMRQDLLPLANLLTPNLPEAAVLLQGDVGESPAQMAEAARALAELGPDMVYLKGGHGSDELINDVFVVQDEVHVLSQPRLNTTSTHGTGCTRQRPSLPA